MKIVIVGAGEVGTHLAKMLSNDEHDIVLIDDDEEKLRKNTANVDLEALTGSAVSMQSLRDAGISKTDLFIAVTPLEERNIVACTLARDLGAKKTIARIDNSEYLEEENRGRLAKMGIDELIYPENLASKEIINALKMTGVRQMLEFCGGKLVLVAIKIRANAPMLNKPLEEITLENDEFRAIAITRKGQTIIPKGQDYILEEDLVYFFTYRNSLPKLLKDAGKTVFEVKNVMILGGSRIGQKAALLMEERGYNVKIIEIDKPRSLKIADKLRKSIVIQGDGRNLDLLKEIGIQNMDAFVAVTGNSETNILSCHLAKKMGVKRTVAEVENTDYMRLADEIGIGSLINKKLLAASYIYRFTMEAEVSQTQCLTSTDAEVLEFVAAPNSQITRKPIRSIYFPEEAKIGGIIRGESVLIAKGETQVMPGDRVVVFSLPSVVKKLEVYFK
ncbi:MAG: Trk system potassium transporter TrkA [Bacteroidota bacterium]|nr:Trk system potassium transporter TrkA [Bacteroidota bacterium]